MSDKPMLSIELLSCPFCGITPKPFSHPQHAPVEVTCDDEECAAFNIVVSLESWNKRAVPESHHKVEPVIIQAVAVTREDEDEGLRLEWLLEGGISEMEFSGMTLFAIPEANGLCDEDGSAEIYLSPQPCEKTVTESASHTMKSIMAAVEESKVYTVLTSNQCRALAQSLNRVKP